MSILSTQGMLFCGIEWRSKGIHDGTLNNSNRSWLRNVSRIQCGTKPLADAPLNAYFRGTQTG